MRLSARRPILFACALLLGVVTVGPALALPPGIPDAVPGIAEPVERGDLIVVELADRTPSAKVVDGDIDDWIGTSARLSGNSHFDRGEFIHAEFVWDAYGADAGEDVQRYEDFAELFHQETRTRRLDATARTLESQLGVPPPIGGEDEWGNLNHGLQLADMFEVRLAADDDALFVLLRTTTMADFEDVSASDLGVLLLADTGPGGTSADSSLGLPDDHRFDVVLEFGDNALGTPAGASFAQNPDGWTNAVEIAVPLSTVASGGTLDLSIITGQVAGDGTFTPLNIAFRHIEPVDIWNNQMQSFALHGDAPDGSHVDDFSTGPLEIADLRDGRTQSVRPGPGYHERQFLSGENISIEQGKDGIVQPYGLFVPNDFDPSAVTPMTFWLHYRGGKAHSGAAINPRMIHDLAREDPSELGISASQGNLVVTPHARGTSFWYVSRSHQDFFEVFEDVHDLFANIDPQRRYLSGYSMGGYGTYLMAGLYPDLFAAGYPTSGAVTQGAWTGVKDSEICDFREPFSGDEASPCYIEANSGNASAQLNHRILENTRHVPLHIDHGTNDELVPVTGVQLMAARLVELGHRIEMQTFPGYEHFTQAAVDEWTNGSNYLQRFTAPVNPRRVTYKVVPALTWALNTVRWDGEPFDFNPDGAYWVDGIEVRDPDIEDPTSFGLVDVTSLAIDEPPILTIPVAGVASAGHSTPYALYGLDWIEDLTATAEVANGFEATLTGASAVTFHARRMGIDPNERLSATMTTDGPATVTMGFFWPGEGNLTCDCGVTRDVAWTSRVAEFELTEAGTWTLSATLDPTAVPQPSDGPGGTGGGSGGQTPSTGGGFVLAGLAVLAVAAGSRLR